MRAAISLGPPCGPPRRPYEDTRNYYPARDGHIEELDRETATSTELLQRHLPKSKVVKGFNHIYAAELTPRARHIGFCATPASTNSPKSRGITAIEVRLLGVDSAAVRIRVPPNNYASQIGGSDPSERLFFGREDRRTVGAKLASPEGNEAGCEHHASPA